MGDGHHLFHQLAESDLVVLSVRLQLYQSDFELYQSDFDIGINCLTTWSSSAFNLLTGDPLQFEWLRS